ncbi:MAG: HDIG domain-containing metalloprotein [Candidatus Dormibacteria bacterium]
MIPSREQAWALLTEHTQGRGLLGHCLAVEAAMRAYALRLGEDPELYGVVGLLHDFDYEQNPTREAHPSTGLAILESMGVDEVVRRAIASHADYMGVERRSNLERVLFAVDELTGLVIATALVRPTRSLADVTPDAVIRKMKDRTFARAVSRDDIRAGAESLGLSLDEHVGVVVAALQEISAQLGL